MPTTRASRHFRGAGQFRLSLQCGMASGATRIPPRRFRTCRGAGEAINRGAVDPLMLKAVEIRQPDPEARALTRWIDEVVAMPGWLVFFTHDIAPNPTSYGCTLGTFEHLVRHAVERGCAVQPVDRILDRIGW